MNEQQALAKMVAPGTPRPGKYRQGVIQIWVTRACDKACFGCTQGSNLRGRPGMMTPEQFEQAVLSLKGYWGVVGVFGGNPAIHPQFPELCLILQQHIPYEQRGLWCNNPLGHGRIMRETFNPSVSNLNVHLDRKAYDEFKRDWPECNPVGLTQDSRHSPPYVAMKDVLKKPCHLCRATGNLRLSDLIDVGQSDDEIEIVQDEMGKCPFCNGTGQIYDEEKAWELISDCDINKHWSAMIGVFRGEVRAWFCEIAGAQAMLHQHEPDYPDTGVRIETWKEPGKLVKVDNTWWMQPMEFFADQVRKHCHECSVPLRGYGELAQRQDGGQEQVSETHAGIYHSKVKGRPVQIVTTLDELRAQSLGTFTHYLQNSRR